MENVWIIRLRQIDSGIEADSMLFRGTLEAARAHAEAAIAGHANLAIAGIRARGTR